MYTHHIPFEEIDAAALRNISYIQSLFPFNRIDNYRLKSGNIYGEEGESFSLQLTGNNAGIWKDFATDEGGKGIIALVAKRDGINNGEAARKVSEDINFPLQVFLGHSNHQNETRSSNSQISRQINSNISNYEWKYPLPHGKKIKLPKYQGILNYNNPDYIFSYRDEYGNELYQKIRWEPNGFSKETKYRRLDGNRWIYKNALKNIKRVPYNLPNILNSNESDLFIVEGEKHVDKLTQLGILATSSKDWKTEYNFPQFLQGKIIYIIPDFDLVGRSQALNVAIQCSNFDLNVKIVELDGLKNIGDDILDWLEIEGNTIEKLKKISHEAPDFKLTATTNSSTSTANDSNIFGINFINQISISKEFESLYKGNLIYDPQQGMWYHWENEYWVCQVNEYCLNLIKKLCEKKSLELIATNDKKAITLAKQITTRNFVSGVEFFCKCSIDVFVLNSKFNSESIWDKNHFLLGVKNGVVDLFTGEFREAKREDYITKRCSVAPVDDKPILWLKFLNESTGFDEEMIDYLQKICGYFLTGDTSEQALFFIYGPGGNGKSVFLEIINSIIGDYAATATMTAFTLNKTEQHTTDLAMLKGARLVSVAETEKGKTWAESRIKQLTGGDRITARFMRQDNFSFLPTFKILIIGNHKPIISNVDDAIRRRLHLIPFTNKPLYPDPNLKEKLLQEAGSILNWMIEGCIKWKHNGLYKNSTVENATNAYFDEEDSLSQWITECCIIENLAKSPSSDLYTSWKCFAEKNGLIAGSNKSFSADLEKKGFVKKKQISGMFFLGIKLKQKDDFNPYEN